MGALYSAMDELRKRSVSAGGRLTPKDIAWFLTYLNKNKLDAHLIIMGQNGFGKSYAAMQILEECGGFDPEAVFYPQSSLKDFAMKITELQDRRFLMDELSQLFPYKRSSAREQVSMFSAIEVARANRNIFVGCCRDILRINNNYRNGKAMLAIWLLDTIGEPPTGSWGAVLLGNPSMELEDKFFITMVRPTYQLEELAQQVEALPTFIGYIKFELADRIVGKAKVAAYEARKREGIIATGVKEVKKGKLD